MELIARYYLVTIVKIERADRSEQLNYDEHLNVVRTLAGLVEHNPDAYLQKRDWHELVLSMKGNTAEYLEEERDLLLERMQQAVNQTRYRLNIGMGSPKNRILDVYQSFVEALVGIQDVTRSTALGANLAEDKAELLALDRSGRRRASSGRCEFLRSISATITRTRRSCGEIWSFYHRA